MFVFVLPKAYTASQSIQLLAELLGNTPVLIDSAMSRRGLLLSRRQLPIA
jgi:hypothetical protein